jgi:hypothetical protein
VSLHLVRQALEVALAAMSPALATAYENVPFAPTPGTPYQAAYLLPATPDNIEIGQSYVERGYLQVNLNYPLDTGPAAATARAEMIRSTFYRGASFSAGGIVTNIEQTPEIGSARIDEDRYFLPVKIRFYAHVRS